MVIVVKHKIVLEQTRLWGQWRWKFYSDRDLAIPIECSVHRSCHFSEHFHLVVLIPYPGSKLDGRTLFKYLKAVKVEEKATLQNTSCLMKIHKAGAWREKGYVRLLFYREFDDISDI